MKDEAHPADDDYLHCCRENGVDPEFVSVHQLFRWCDVQLSGKVGRDELSQVWSHIQTHAQGIGPLDEDMWKQLDDDGNGFINFAEFAEFTTRSRVALPLGLDSLLGCMGTTGTLRCGVNGCKCQNFQERRRRCKFGEKCYQAKKEHKDAFCHPCDEDWDTGAKHGDSDMCRCGHKKKLHASSMSLAGAVQYPRYWVNVARGDHDFNQLVPLDGEMMTICQRLVDATYEDITTRDRLKHSGSWMVPKSFMVCAAYRNENSKLWCKYLVKKAGLLQEKRLTNDNPDIAKDLPEYVTYSEIKTTVACKDAGAEPLNEEINEWYLWHGTSASAAHNICSTDFKMQLAGSATGTLYGKGTYLAESITKADEYAKLEGDTCTVMLCRVLGGRVRLCEERTPDAEELTNDCLIRSYDCVLGDRRKVSGTYREFVIFDTENVYPEYILNYKRGELFKSKSFPS